MYDFDEIVDRRPFHSDKWDVKEGELPMWVADMDFRTAPEIREAIQRRLDHGIFGYSIVPDSWYEAYVGWWKERHGFVMDKSWLIFASGVVPAISCLVRKLTTPAEKVVLMTPVYNIFFNSIVNNGRYPLESPLRLSEKGYDVDWTDLEEKLADGQATLLILCNPQNPGGRVWRKEELARIAQLCEEHGVVVISDEIHCDLTDPGVSYVPFASVSPIAREISVTCISPSKAFNVAGIHSAAVVVPNALLRHKVWRALNTDEVAEPNSFAVEVAVAAFSKGSSWLDAVRAYIYRNKQRVAAFLSSQVPELKMIVEDATYLVWIDVHGLPHEGKGFASFLREHAGLYLSDGSQYGKGGEGFVRMNVACPERVVEDGLVRLAKGVTLFKETC